MLDFDLAELYDVETKQLNQQVRRNLSRFPKDFMFRLTVKEWKMMRSQIVTASQKKRNIGLPPLAFTEHGVTILASVLKSERAAKMNVTIVRTFIAMRKFVNNYKGLAEEIKKLYSHLGEHDLQLKGIYIALEKLLVKEALKQRWEDRERIGFKK